MEFRIETNFMHKKVEKGPYLINQISKEIIQVITLPILCLTCSHEEFIDVIHLVTNSLLINSATYMEVVTRITTFSTWVGMVELSI
jgi:hypothetical protein